MQSTTAPKPHKYHLWELSAKTSSKELYELAQIAAELHVDRHPSGTLKRGEWDEDAQSVVFAIHRKLWEMPRKSDHSHPPYTHKLVNATSVVAAAKAAFPDWKRLWGEKELGALAMRAYRILAGNQLLMRYGAGSAWSFFLIRAWPEGYAPGYYNDSVYLSYKDEVDIAKQQARAEELAGPVKVIYDLESIPAPEPNPKSVMEYLEKLKALIGKLVAENAELREQLENKDGWDAVVASIKGSGTVVEGGQK